MQNMKLMYYQPSTREQIGSFTAFLSHKILDKYIPGFCTIVPPCLAILISTSCFDNSFQPVKTQNSLLSSKLDTALMSDMSALRNCSSKTQVALAVTLGDFSIVSLAFICLEYNFPEASYGLKLL